MEKKLSLIFEPEPTQWGLRGDPHLWKELSKLSQQLPLPNSPEELIELLLILIKSLIGDELSGNKNIYVARYATGGMSSGMICSEFWLNQAIPLLQERLARISSSNLE